MRRERNSLKRRRSIFNSSIIKSLKRKKNRMSCPSSKPTSIFRSLLFLKFLILINKTKTFSRFWNFITTVASRLELFFCQYLSKLNVCSLRESLNTTPRESTSYISSLDGAKTQKLRENAPSKR